MPNLNNNFKSVIRTVSACLLIVFTALLVLESVDRVNSELKQINDFDNNKISILASHLEQYKKFPNSYSHMREISHAYSELGYAQQSHEFIQKMVMARPVWPLAWHSFLKSNIRMNDISSREFSNVLKTSVRLGANNLYLRKSHLQLAFDLRDKELHDESWYTLDQVVIREIQKMPEFVKTMAFKERKEQIICSNASLSKYVYEWCKEINEYRVTCEGSDNLTLGQWSYCDKYKKYWEARQH